MTLKVSESEGQVLTFLNTVSLNSEPYYEAISYVWEDPSNKTPILLNGCWWHVTSNLGTVLHSLAIRAGEKIYWVDAICIYSYRTAMKRVGNLRFIPQFSEGFHFVSERKNSCSVLSRYILYIPRFILYLLLFPFRKGSEGALIEHVTEYRRNHGRVGGSAAEIRPSTRRTIRSAALILIRRS
jgi:hypothetical protein